MAHAYASHADREVERAKVRAAAPNLTRPWPPVLGHKETSPELASLAAKYARMSDAEMRSWVDPVGTERALTELFFANVRRLAASVLSQTEPKP